MRLRRISARLLGARARMGDESGMALVMALGIMLVLVIALTTVITFTAAGARDAHRVNAGQKASALAEAGLNNALAVLHTTYDAGVPYPGTAAKCVLHPQPAPTRYAGYDASLDASACGSLTPFKTAYDGGSCVGSVDKCVTWSGVLVPAGPDSVWVIRSSASVRNPTGPSAQNIVRVVTAKVPVVKGEGAVGAQSPLNWIYGENIVFKNSVGVSTPVYATGNLTLSSTSVICGSAKKVVVHGNMTLENPQNQAGQIADTVKCPDKGTPPVPDTGMLARVHVLGTCKYKNHAALPAPCTPGTNGDDDNVYATISQNSIPADQIVNASLDFPNALLNARPGPNYPCNSNDPSGTAPPFSFAIGGNPGSSSSSPTNLTPPSSYSCKFMIGSYNAGELSWDNSSKILTINGLVYIDAHATVTQSATYVGKGYIYLTGTFSMTANGQTLCAVKTGATCDVSKWDPNDQVLVIVTNGEHWGSASETAEMGSMGIFLKAKVEFQGGLVARRSILTETNAIAQGPMVSVEGVVNAGQSNNLSFPPIQFLPGGGLGSDPPPAKLLAVQDFEG